MTNVNLTKGISFTVLRYAAVIFEIWSNIHLIFFNKTRQRLRSVRVTIQIFWNDWAVACYQSGFLDACTSLGFCKLQERGAGAWILPENTQVFTNANKSRQPRTGNLRKCINICMYAFQINVMVTWGCQFKIVT